MKAFNYSHLRTNLADVLNSVNYGGERVVISRHHKELAALISIEDLKRLEDFEVKEDIKAAHKIKESIKKGRGKLLDWDEAKKALDV